MSRRPPRELPCRFGPPETLALGRRKSSMMTCHHPVPGWERGPARHRQGRPDPVHRTPSRSRSAARQAIQAIDQAVKVVVEANVHRPGTAARQRWPRFERRDTPGGPALRRGPGLVDEHQPAGIEIGLALEPGPAARGDVQGAPARRRARFFFRSWIAMAARRTATPCRSRPTGRALSAAPARLREWPDGSGVSSTTWPARTSLAAPSIRPDRRSPPLG